MSAPASISAAADRGPVGERRLDQRRFAVLVAVIDRGALGEKLCNSVGLARPRGIVQRSCIRRAAGDPEPGDARNERSDADEPTRACSEGRDPQRGHQQQYSLGDGHDKPPADVRSPDRYIRQLYSIRRVWAMGSVISPKT